MNVLAFGNRITLASNAFISKQLNSQKPAPIYLSRYYGGIKRFIILQFMIVDDCILQLYIFPKWRHMRKQYEK